MTTDFLFIQNKSIDVLQPSLVMTEITSIVCDMLEENIAFVKKNGLTEKAQTNRDRLLKLLDITEMVNKISSDNYSLKTINNHLLNTIGEVKRQELMANSI